MVATKRKYCLCKLHFWWILSKNHGKKTDQLIIKAKKDEEPDEFVLEILQEWVNEMAKKVGYSSLKAYASGINRYLKYRKIKIDLKDIEWPQNIQEERYAISLEEIQKIIEIAPYDRKAFYIWEDRIKRWR